MKKIFLSLFFLLFCSEFFPQSLVNQEQNGPVKLSEMRWRDVCILPDPVTKTYFIVGPGRRSVRMYSSKDLVSWYGPKTIYDPPQDVWGDIPVVSIWAPELHYYKGKYYLFLTFDTRHKLSEQWRNWLPRVTRGSQVLVGDNPSGPFTAFNNHSTLPVDMMTLDGTLWVEDGIPYMVYCHEWVQITDGAVGYVRLRDDLSDTIGTPSNLFRGSQGPWTKISDQYGCHVTDGPYLHMGRTGKLYMIWTSGGKEGEAMGIAVSESGRLKGPWIQQAEPVYKADGGHGMIFTTFDNRLMLILHSPYNGNTRPHLFELEDTGETLKILREVTDTPQK